MFSRLSGTVQRLPRLWLQPPAPSQNWCRSPPEAGGSRNGPLPADFLENRQPFGSGTKLPRQRSGLWEGGSERKGTWGEFVPPAKAPISIRNKSMLFITSLSLLFLS